MLERLRNPHWLGGRRADHGLLTAVGWRVIPVWPVQDAKARFVPIEQWRRLQASAQPSLKQLLLAPEARTEELAPPRGTARRRPVVEL